MPRFASTAFQTEAALRAGAVRCDFLEADFGVGAGVLRLWTGVGEKTWNAVVWYSGLGLIAVRGGAEKADGTTEPLTFTLAMRDKAEAVDLVAKALAARTAGKVRAWRGWLDRTSGAVVVDPIPRSLARISLIQIQEAAANDSGAPPVTISVTAEQHMSDRDRSLHYRVTHASQMEFDATDLGLVYQATVADDDLKWGDLFYHEVKGD